MREQKKINPLVAQPVERVHPETGRKALYIGEKVSRFDGLTEEESRPLIDYLVRHATRPEFVYRHQWRKNDILVWDNRCTMHHAPGARRFRRDAAAPHGAHHRARHAERLRRHVAENA